ncbi:MAG: adenylate/guanylate cyclase domain-containing protein [Gammaproteobacteria bacterium]|nr:adenylate/guanylate cyclase domain-containing protein [Gammaproteobacteria bacterium]
MSTANSTTLVILFADVVGSTKLYELMGDAKARETVGRCVELMASAATQNQGEVIKTMGDEIMATFSDVDHAAQAACDMQGMISDEHRNYEVPVAIRVGFHYGPVMREAHDVFGTAVHVASRLTGQAKAAQIITSGDSVERLSTEWQPIARQIDVTVLRGQSEEVRLFELLWQQEETTRMLPAIDWREATMIKPKHMRLSYRGQEVTVCEDKSVVTIGRSERSDLVIKDTLISRVHARIEYKRGRFLLFDQSTNGTCVCSNDGKEHFVRRDSIQLSGEGAIGLGRVPQIDSPQSILFSQED